ncbi:BON domain-containing protein [Candidatus Cyanaurora vandensis]|uniref:BON domain-containing protein n=1 Tax=Candidatus Cyanaurora vandensis TaxID=2714958 RepID=UPI00257B4E19|nr:BON domain-containing protein [Candidatus Cyanaurora vandensis]
MNKRLMSLLLSAPLVVILAACGGQSEQNTANSGGAMNETGQAMEGAANNAGEAVDGAGEQAERALKDGAQTNASGSAEDAKEDASSETRRAQLNSDIRSREERSNTTGEVSDGDLESKVRSKLEANLQKRELTVNAENGVVTIQGQVASQAEMDKALKLAREINGVKDVRSQLTMGAS